MNDRRSDDLITERDIDPLFGLFTEEDAEGKVPDASEELRNQYPDGKVNRIPASNLQGVPESSRTGAKKGGKKFKK